MGARPGGDGAAVGEWEYTAGEGVFEGDERCWAGVDVGRGDGMALDVREGKVVAVRWRNGDSERAGEGGDAAGFPGKMLASDGGDGVDVWGFWKGRGLPLHDMTFRVCDYAVRRSA